ncbi:Predicted GTPase activator protein [Ceraceosorus bombacis]|uniref:Predicted GTPase activator protein n=1 Tax=Ceraceosorus bombacis TaxID=401625 RepID=A0A0P1BJ23_9BASI|nr:Predicted GTPase activator protein [Ceraceosorus bombacis]
MPSIAVVDIAGGSEAQTKLQTDPRGTLSAPSKTSTKRKASAVKLDLIALRSRAISPGGFGGHATPDYGSFPNDSLPDGAVQRRDGSLEIGQSRTRNGGLAHLEGIDCSKASRRVAWLILLDLQYHIPSLVEIPNKATSTAKDEPSLEEHFANLLREEWEPREDRLHPTSRHKSAKLASDDESDWQTALPRHKKRKERVAKASTAASSDAGVERDDERSAAASTSSFGAGASTTTTGSVNQNKLLNDTKESARPRQEEALNPSKKKRRPKGAKGLRRAKEHKDESQVALDVNRSFVGDAWSSNVPLVERTHRRKQLSEVVAHVLRRHPALSYYQGYHDVISVLIVTLAPTIPEIVSEEEGASLWCTAAEGNLVKDAAIRLSLHWLRDFMSTGLEPALGALKVLHNLLRAADAELAKAVEIASPLPYFALSWIISMLCHDLGPCESARALDYFLCAGPAGTIYFTASLLIANRDALLALAEVDADPAELHHHLSQLVNSMSESGPATDVLAQILSSASLLQNKYPLCSPQAETDRIMGPKSVLCSFDKIKRQANAEQWMAKDKEAERILSGPLDWIVLDYSPSSPEADVEVEKDNVNRIDTKLDKRVPNGGHAALLVAGALGAATAVILYGASSGQLPPQTMSLLRSLAGRGRL